MQLNKKKALAARTLGVGKERILFNEGRLAEIKEAITKQDIRDLIRDGSITIKEIRGAKTREKSKTRRKAGSIKKKVNARKREYMLITRKLRAYLFELKKQEKITYEEYNKLRKEVKSKLFRSKAHLKERISSMVKDRGDK